MSPVFLPTPKPRPELIPPRALLEVARTYTVGAAKHPERGHLERTDIDAELGAALRHVLARLEGQWVDGDGLLHLACAASRCLNALGMDLRGDACSGQNGGRS